MAQQFTGKKMTAVMVGGFAVVIAVNLTMATFATRGFSGTVVDNSYVASQNFNSWLDAADAQEALGWDAQSSRSDGNLLVQTSGLPEGAIVTAQARRPLGDPEAQSFSFDAGPDGAFVSTETLPEGRWIVRLTITAGAESWVAEQRI
ncbi:FixH family protein [Aurantiacibacter sediminis]|uniref:FixH family protein n=1 Tax=Aurantiacibacter sediminis TaxID=2793064 RepID=A0ABS0N3G7_9SPHN|nr:FixH family protein [Aurantiacibacter sediminis]MBH5321791.1 FixH family protein [Aurantiacibacter sediminis]